MPRPTARIGWPRRSIGAACGSSKGDYAGAEEQFTAALTMDSASYPARLGRGVARESKGDRSGAAEDYLEAVRLRPRSPDANLRLGLTLLDARARVPSAAAISSGPSSSSRAGTPEPGPASPSTATPASATAPPPTRASRPRPRGRNPARLAIFSRFHGIESREDGRSRGGDRPPPGRLLLEDPARALHDPHRDPREARNGGQEGARDRRDVFSRPSRRRCSRRTWGPRRRRR